VFKTFHKSLKMLRKVSHRDLPLLKGMKRKDCLPLTTNEVV